MKSKLLFYLIIVALLNSNYAHSQTNNQNVRNDTIRYSKSNERYFLNNKKLPITKLKPMLAGFSASAVELKEYRKLATPGAIILLSGLTAGVIAFTRMNKEPNFFNPYTITLFAGDVIGITLMIFANRHLKKSVKLYNQEILK